MSKPECKTGSLVKVTKRTFLEGKDRLSAVSFTHHLSTTGYRANKEDDISIFYHETTKLTFFLGGKIIVLHSCDLIPLDEAFVDFCKKLDVIIDSIQEALTHLEDKTVRHPHFHIKRFLNGDEGASAIYTSMIALTGSRSHGFTLDIASCDYKSRIYLGGRSPAIKFLKRVRDFVQMAHDHVWDSYQKYGEEIKANRN